MEIRTDTRAKGKKKGGGEWIFFTTFVVVVVGVVVVVSTYFYQRLTLCSPARIPRRRNRDFRKRFSIRR